MTHIWASICELPADSCLFVCGPAAPHQPREKTWGRRSVLKDFPSKMLFFFLTSENLTYVYIALFKMRHPATRPPIRMWVALQWPEEFPVQPLAIVSHPGTAASIPYLGFHTPRSFCKYNVDSTLSTSVRFPEPHPGCILSPPRLPGLKQLTAIDVSCWRHRGGSLREGHSASAPEPLSSRPKFRMDLTRAASRLWCDTLVHECCKGCVNNI